MRTTGDLAHNHVAGLDFVAVDEKHELVDDRIVLAGCMLCEDCNPRVEGEPQSHQVAVNPSPM